ncbi:hypothetical protein QN277_021700 [Acacia crassicarpa]|uniref:BRCT domain-containing protein n=1 Tax=Acacia crassicarpa TaxID=499986 RepID=A0AAE1MMB4_9FABA|nr:hypothetical protein QN277_021700 [Acacia crassicarpa]
MLETSIPSQVFLNIRFVLYGFDPINESKVRFKLVNGGGVDVGQCVPSCTHVVVGKLTYDDPICLAARNDGKTLVTALWVDHSVDIGMAVDATSVMYRPLKDLNGIPGAKNLVVCLTGYQRQDRDDIMTMVGLMGAEFSKPLVASKVTHLICYKFEGEKYELASRLQTIKLVNHRWLEDCLKDWLLLPEEKYKKSGYELETMAEEAKDSEEEAEDLVSGKSGGRGITKSPFSSKMNTTTTHNSSKPVVVESNAFPGSAAPEGSRKANERHESMSIIKIEKTSDQTRNAHHDVLESSSGDPGVSRRDASGQLPDTCAKTTKPKNTCVQDAVDCQNLGIPGNADSSGHAPDLQVSTSEYGKLVNDLRLTSDSVEGHLRSDARGSAATSPRKTLKRFSPPSGLNENLGNLSEPSASPLNNLKLRNDLEASSNKVEKASDSINFDFVEGSGKGNRFSNKKNKKGPSSLLAKKRSIEASTKLNSMMTKDTKLSIERSPLADGNKLPEIEHHFPVGRDDMKDKESVSSESLQHDALKINGEPDIADRGWEEVAQDGNETEPHNTRNDLECSYSSKKKSRNEESTGHASLDLCNKVSDKLIRKSPRKKTVAKKCLGSRPKSGATAKKKSLISLDENTLKADGAGCLSGRKETALCDGKKLVKSSKIVSVEISAEQESVCKSAENTNGREFQDEETEAPDEKIEYEGLTVVEDNRESVNILKKYVTQTEEKFKATHHASKSKSKPPKEDTNGTKPVELELVDSTSKGKGKPKGRKLTEGRTKKAPFTKDKMRPEEAASNERKDETDMETMETALFPAGKDSGSAVQTNSAGSFQEVEKENRPIDGEGINIGNSVIKTSAGQAKVNQKTWKKALISSTSEDNRRVKKEAACFLVSGHRLQRKEFQQLIRRLKGRVCRDTHQWSYQATHFIAPDPVRRTEKFFAAAASGRWILKTDYLTACSEAGKFLTEEPYEWHKSGLSEDGAINLEAPRRWRLLREKTGHGVLYGVRIIVYGDCIVPPLDTLKRVVKAGDGTILATSPPYTRFLDAGIDFAIVSPGMPRVDMWVQEFLKHEIPCVLADYLVEYVCKPGFSLEKHVLYGTHAWAERSFANLQRKAEEIIEDPPEIDDNDAACQVCGSRDRGDVMLICGDESGSVGCGVGIHIDCCDPPLKDVPEEDWFCPKCTETRNCSSSNKKRKKGVLSSSKIK